MAYSCWAALRATYRTLSRSLPKGRCSPCFSSIPNGSRHVPCARAMASRNSAAVSSSQCTDGLLCADGGDGAAEVAGAQQLEDAARCDGRHVAPLVIEPPRVASLRDAVTNERETRRAQRDQLV